MIVATNTPVYTIGAAAKILEISVHTLRMYEREGLIIPFKKKSRQRLYSQEDIERLTCIRAAINRDKISIEGIKRILSLVPCWSFIKCPEEERDACPAYCGHTEPCWTIRHEMNVCARLECRECEVYRNYGDCGAIKATLRDLLPG